MSWEKLKLGEVCILNYGKNLPASKRQDGSVPVYSSAGQIDFHSLPHVDSEGIIIGRKGSVGKIYFSDVPFFPIDTSYYIIPDEKYNLKFLYYNIQILGLEDLNSDAAVPGLNRNNAYSQLINIPPLQTQKRIADILSAYDDLIVNNLKRIKLLEQAAQNIYKEWFVNMRFPGHENTPDNEETGLPVGWEEVLIGELFNTSSGGTPSRRNSNFFNGKIKWFKTKELWDCLLIDSEEHISIDALKKSSAKMFPKNTVVMAMYGATIGRLAILTDGGSTNQACCAFLNKNKVYNHHYAFHWLKSNREHILGFRMGAAQENISQSIIKELKIIKPKENIVLEFNKIQENNFNLTLNLTKQNQKLKAARDILLPRLMNRTIEV